MKELYKDDCLFCRIIKGEIPSSKVYEDEFAYAFRDINPQAPTHVLVVPKCHVQSCAEINEDNAELVGHIFTAIARVAESEGLTAHGFRVISNAGPDACQSVPHLHFHVLGGKKLTEKMG